MHCNDTTVTPKMIEKVVEYKNHDLDYIGETDKSYYIALDDLELVKELLRVAGIKVISITLRGHLYSTISKRDIVLVRVETNGMRDFITNQNEFCIKINDLLEELGYDRNDANKLVTPKFSELPHEYKNKIRAEYENKSGQVH